MYIKWIFINAISSFYSVPIHKGLFKTTIYGRKKSHKLLSSRNVDISSCILCINKTYLTFVSVTNESGPRRGDIPWQWNYYDKKWSHFIHKLWASENSNRTVCCCTSLMMSDAARHDVLNTKWWRYDDVIILKRAGNYGFMQRRVNKISCVHVYMCNTRVPCI